LSDTLLTADALLYYTLGLWAFSSVRVSVSAFYSLQDTRIPMKGAILALIVNVIMSLILMGPLKHGGLALATSLGSAANVLYLSYVLWRRIGSFLERDFFTSLIKVSIASGVMLVAMMLCARFYPWLEGAPFASRAVYLALQIGVGLFVFAWLAWLLKTREMTLLADALARKLGKQLTRRP